MNKLFTVKGGKFKLSAQGRDLALFVGNGTKVIILSEIKLPLLKKVCTLFCFRSTILILLAWFLKNQVGVFQSLSFFELILMWLEKIFFSKGRNLHHVSVFVTNPSRDLEANKFKKARNRKVNSFSHSHWKIHGD